MKLPLALQAGGAGAEPPSTAPASGESIATRPLAKSPFAAVCESGTKPHSCARCPDYTSFSGTKHGRMWLVSEGSFIEPGARESVIALFGCEPHANNFGGLVTVRETGEGWLPIAYLPGVLPYTWVWNGSDFEATERTCSKREAGRKLDHLLCLETYRYNGGTYTSGAAVYDLQHAAVYALYSASCESGVDVDRAAWKGGTGLVVELSVTHGVKRGNADGLECKELSRKRARTDTVTFQLVAGVYQPSDATRRTLPAKPDDAVADQTWRDVAPTPLRMDTFE